MAASPLATAFVLIRPSTAGFGPTLKRELNGAAATAGTAGGAAGKSWAASFQKSGVLKTANRISEGVLAIGAASVYAAVKFQSSMEKLSTQAGVSQSKIKSLGDGVLKLAGQVGFSPDSLATSLYHVESSFASLGITSTKALSLVKIAAEGAAVGGANLEDVTNALTAVMASGIKVTHGMSGAMGTLNAIVGAGDMKMQDLADAFGTGLLASIKGFGVSITDAGAALATFGDNNIRGAKAGTQLRMAIQALAAPTGAGKKILEGWGWSVGRLAKDMQKGGLKKALEDLQAQFRKTGITGKEQGQVLTELFGKRAGVGIQILLGQMTRFESKFKDLAKGSGTFGAAWAKTQATASQQMKELGHGLEAVGVTIGERLLPPLMSVFGFVKNNTGLVLGFGAAIAATSLIISGVSLVMRGIAAATVIWNAVTTAVTFFKDAAIGTRVALLALAAGEKIAAAAQWLWNVAMDANPIGLIIIAIAALVGAIIYAYTHFKWFRDFVQTVWKGIQIGAEWLWNALKVGFDAVWGFLKTVWGGLKRGFDDVWGAIRTGVRWIVNLFLSEFSMMINGAAKLFGWLPGGVGKDLQAAAAKFDAFRNRVNAALGGIQDQHVALIFGLNLPAGVSYPQRPIKGHAAGWRVPGYGGGDRWPAMLEGGEAVVPKHLVPAVAPFLSANKVPGFTRGGLIGVSASLPATGGLTAALTAFAATLARHVAGILQASLPSPSSFGGGAGGPGGGVPSANAALARRMMPAWASGSAWQAWNYVAMRESGWSQFADNASSGAYGIPQALPYTKMPRAAWPAWAGGSSNPAAQIGWMISYIAGRYGSPQAAAAHEVAFNWYDRGGWLPAGLSLAYNGTGRPERVIAGNGGAGVAIGTVNVYMPPGSDGASIVRELQAYARNNGPIRLKVRS